MAPTFYRLSFRRAGENSLLAARVLVACCAGARKGEPPLLFCPCRSKVALLHWFAHIAPVAPQGIIAASATGGVPIPCPSEEGNHGAGGQILFSLPLLSLANRSPTSPALRCPKNHRTARLLDFFDHCGCSASLHLSRAALGSASHSLRPGNNQDRYFLPLAIPPYNEADRLGSAWAVGAYLDEAAGRLFYFSSRARAYGIWARAGRRRRKIPTGPPLNLPPENFCSIREQIFVLDLHSRQKSCTMKSRLR